MSVVLQVIREQLNHIDLIFRLALFEAKGKYQTHYLGVLWNIIQPLLVILTYWLVFGLGIRGGSPVGDTPYFVWLIAGLIPWLFISPSIVRGANSVYAKISLVSKMNFPVSVLPAISIVGNMFDFLVMLLLQALILLVYRINPGLYVLQLPYYMICTFVFLYAFTLLFSTMSTIVRDVQSILQSAVRMMLYLLPILWDVHRLPEMVVTVLKLNPFFYIITGFRQTFLGEGWFFEDPIYTIYFWVTTLFFLYLGSTLHMKFRHKFVDYL
ncbi:ABC transporter permease [Geobacillus thermodenitrificans]|jgi:teichoic acid transport system permease protein|uniref:ABC transporter permease n=1 Tax=Geobacillus thermodenitrificans TaxID=33940 RepID=UPI000A2925E6|nr:ABC transporter permease [Geobacillus thermodenitrificans]ARP44274.1 O-antigen export system permease protein RfbA [Geobacillus thermodenitrificans]MEC5188055.1 teichoic acid transport system permease protein [Geobacillus thermodenitrificans]MED0663278.1 ABC transporter permease [Geobacillus thermodenitrificans]